MVLNRRQEKVKTPPFFSRPFAPLCFAWAFLNGGEFKNRFMGQLNIVGKTDSLTSYSYSVNSLHPFLHCINTSHQPSPVFVSFFLPLVFYKMIYLLKRWNSSPSGTLKHKLTTQALWFNRHTVSQSSPPLSILSFISLPLAFLSPISFSLFSWPTRTY